MSVFTNYPIEPVLEKIFTGRKLTKAREEFLDKRDYFTGKHIGYPYFLCWLLLKEKDRCCLTVKVMAEVYETELNVMQDLIDIGNLIEKEL